MDDIAAGFTDHGRRNTHPMQTAWCTSLIPQAQRAEFWRSAVCNAFLAMTPRISCTQDFEARLDHLSLDRVALNRVTAPAHGVSRTTSDIKRDDKQVFFLNMSPRGHCHVRQHGREHTTQPGELILIDSSVPYAIDLPEHGELLSLAIPREWLNKSCPQASDRTATKLNTSTASYLLCQQMVELTRLASIDAHQSGVISQVLVSLLSGALSDPGLCSLATSTHLRKLRKLIVARYVDPDFGPPEAAILAGISLRALHTLFAKVGSTFGTELQQFRLEQARLILLQSTHDAFISRIAVECGFKSGEHFSRSFRRRFGETPSQFRLKRH